MAAAIRKPTLRTCPNGHQYLKSSDCPVCPICEQKKTPSDVFLSAFSAPARRALEKHGITSAKKLSGFTEKEVLSFHGIGPSSIPALKAALKKLGLNFAK